MKHSWLMLVLVSCSTELYSQSLVRLDDAIGIALNNNYQIKIAQNESLIAKNNNHAGAAGMLPYLSVNATDNPQLNNIKQEYSTGTSIVRKNVESNQFGANATLTYTLFDGLKMFATKKKLNQLEELGDNKMKTQIQNTVSQVIGRYSNLIKQRSYLRVMQQLVRVGEDRLQLVKLKQASGVANNTDLYLAELDLNSRIQSLTSQQTAIKNAFTDLNVLINFPLDSTYAIEENLAFNSNLKYADLDTLLNRNPELLGGENQINIALQTQKEIQAGRMPLLKLNASYNYGLSQNQAGLTLYNQNYGPQGLVTLSVPLFSGNVVARNYKTAKIQTENTRIQQLQSVQSFHGLFEQTWQNYITILGQMQIDKTDVETTQKYLDLMKQRYEMGQSTVIDYREAQRSFDEINFRAISNTYLAKLAETDLLRLTGQLVK